MKVAVEILKGLIVFMLMMVVIPFEKMKNSFKGAK
jgi:hypothetical protein